MNLIVAVDKYWGIGKDNDLLFSLKEDMNFFKQKTLNKVVVMGKNTLLSLPNSKPLKNRINIVLGGSEGEDYTLVKDQNELFKVLKQYNDEDIFVIGGAFTYSTLLPYCKTAFITKVDADGNADVFFPNLDNSKEWIIADKSQEIMDNGFKITFYTYQNQSIKER